MSGNLNLKSEESAFYQDPVPDDQWHEIMHTLQTNLSTPDQETIRTLVQSIRKGIEWLETPMVKYCELTCGDCSDPCCDGRRVFYNRTDMLYLSALQEEIPPGQTRERAGEPCRYLTPNGCLLPRIHRPYICTWFLCEPQMELFLRESSSFQRHFVAVLEEVRTCRLCLESLYERLVPPVSFISDG